MKHNHVCNTLRGSTQRGITLLAMATLWVLTPCAAWDIRSISSGAVTTLWADSTLPPELTAWAVDQTVMVKVSPVTILGMFRADTWLPDSRQISGGLGFSVPLDPHWYSTLGYRGVWNSTRELYSHRIDAEIAREEGPLALVLHERVEFNSQSGASLTTLSATWTPIPLLAFHLAPLLGWDGTGPLTPGLWGYAEIHPGPLVFRLGGSASVYHDSGAVPVDGMTAAVLARVGVQATQDILVGLDGQVNLGDLGRDSGTISLLVDLRF